MTQQKGSMKGAFLWNTASGMINAGQSAVILMFISHFLTQNDAGVFTIAYAFGTLFMTMAKYGMRNYQVTDVQERFGFGVYRKSRVLTTLGAAALMAFYLLVQALTGAYTAQKAVVVAAICLWKLIDAVEDVYYGMYQQQGRLDVGAKYYTYRLAASTALFCALVLLRVPMIVTSLVTLGVSAVLAAVLVNLSARRYHIRGAERGKESLGTLLKVCAPLFVSMSLSIYVGNAPKYMIDWYLDDSAQAVFGYIIMPAFIITVLNQFIYQPIIRDLGELWHSGQREKFKKRVFTQYLMVGAVTAVVILGGVLVGIPVLSLLFNADLAPYKAEFVIMLLGGGVYALVYFITVPLTAMRLQKLISYGFLAASVISLLAGKPLVLAHGVKGAALLYLALNTILAGYLTVCFVRGAAKK